MLGGDAQYGMQSNPFPHFHTHLTKAATFNPERHSAFQALSVCPSPLCGLAPGVRALSSLCQSRRSQWAKKGWCLPKKPPRWYLPEERVQPNGRVTARVPRAAAKLVETVTGTGRGTECPSPGLPGSSR
uniref:Uncharacterized protein n=1 Tax=Eutreptiella gymnastica TaxID=73025 RepID=A0A7S4LGG6_9EUGL